MKKKLTLISLFVLLLCIAFSACGKKSPASTDTSSETNAGAQHTHTEEILPGVAPTCTETGLAEGKKCSECGEILVEQAVLPVTHTEEIIPEVAPTCTEAGLAEGKKCSLCGKILVEQATIAPTKHNYNGSYECTKCDFVIPVSEGLEFTLDAETDTYTVTGIGTCSDSNIVIPYTYKGKSVTRIGYEAFSRCYSLTSISIPNSVTYIDDTAFFGCNSLKYNQFENAYYLGNEENPYLCLDKAGDKNITSCIINETTKIIQDNAFYGCSSLTSITIPDSVASIGNEAFYDCDLLTSIKIPNSVASIGDSAFYDCDSLTSVTIGNGVTKIGGDAFYDCSLITSVSISDIASWCNISFGDSFSNPLTYAQNLYLNGTLVTDLVIPSTVTEIKKYAFVNYDSLTSISIANSVTSIGYEAFYRCHGLTSVTIPDSITSIDDYAFYGCMSLTSITIGNSVTSIGNHAFYDCKKLVEVYNLSSLKITTGSSSNGHVGYYAKVIHTSLNKPSILKTVDDYIFMSWEGKYYLMGYVGNETELTLPESYDDNNYEIYGYAFYERDITKVTIPNSVTKIGDGAFYNCDSLTSVTIGNSVAEIGGRAFCDCSSLTSIAIGNSVTEIGVRAFEGCFSLKSVKINDIASWCNISFSGGASNPLYHAHNLYLNGTLVTDIVIPSTVTKIKNSAFENCTSLTSITIPSSVTSIGSSAFYQCYKLVEVYNLSSLNITKGTHDNGSVGFCAKVIHTSLDEPSILESVDDYLFVYMVQEYKYYLMGYAGNETELTLPDGYKGNKYNIYKYAFHNRDNITKVTIPNSVNYIKDYAFEGCTSITSLTIPNSVYSIGEYAFWNCDSLTSVTIENNIIEIGSHAFCDCNSLTSVTIPDSVTSIGQYAFSDCESLINIIIPDSVTEIGYGAFKDCSSLTIYCEATSKPSDWKDSWNASYRSVYWYSENKPTTEGKYWHYVNGEVVVWE